MRQGVSIIVCCYNSTSRLPDTLWYIAQQKFQQKTHWELIVVDNASTDDTGKQAQCLWQEYGAPAPIRVIYEITPGLIAARAAGIQDAQYEFISFVDDDNWIATNWVKTVFDIFTNKPKVGACGGDNKAVFQIDPPDWFPEFEYLYAVGQQAKQEGVLPNQQYELWGAGLSLRRSVWIKLQHHGFDFSLSGRTGKKLSAGEDSEICMLFVLLGYKLYYSRLLVTHHYMPSSRLSWSYTEKLLEGQACARFPLSVYTELCRSNSYPVRHRRWYWLRFSGKSALIAIYGWLRWKLSLKPTEGNPDYAKFLFYKSVLKDRNYRIDCQTIEKIHQNYLAIQQCK